VWWTALDGHVVDHPSTQRGHLSYHRISCLMIGSGQPQSSQTGAASRQARYHPASGFVQHAFMSRPNVRNGLSLPVPARDREGLQSARLAPCGALRVSSPF
jgi:hypothetical protein